MTIRPERAGDADAIRAVIDAAFAGARHASGTEAAIVDGLRDAGALTLSLVMEEDGRVVGHVAFSPVMIDGEERGWFGLGPVSVAPERQLRGIGSALIREGLARLSEGGAAGCVLLDNPSLYGRFGFLTDPALRYPGAPAPYFQRLAFKVAVPSGEVAFHPAFDAG